MEELNNSFTKGCVDADLATDEASRDHLITAMGFLLNDAALQKRGAIFQPPPTLYNGLFIWLQTFAICIISSVTVAFRSLVSWSILDLTNPTETKRCVAWCYVICIMILLSLEDVEMAIIRGQLQCKTYKNLSQLLWRRSPLCRGGLPPAPFWSTKQPALLVAHP